MINATFTTSAVTAEAADSTGRTIRGVAVPWDQVGTVSDGSRVRFSAGALDAGELPIVTLGHDGPPIGRTAANVSTPAGMETTVRVSRVRDGDEALILAADGVLAMFSVGVDPTDWHYDDDGVMVVDAGEWHHTALLPFGAFAAARVTDVAASSPPPTGAPAMTDTLDTDSAAPDVEAAAPPPPPQRPAIIPVTGPVTAPEPLTLARVGQIIAAGMREQIQAAGIAARIQAALTSVTSVENPGFVRPAYRSEIVGLVDHGMPVVRALQQRPLPATGMRIEYPTWAAPPDDYAIQAAEKTAIGTGGVSSTVEGVDIDTWAQGHDVSFQVAQRSDPSFIDAYLRAAAVDAARKYDTDVITKLLAVANAGTPGTSFVTNVKALFAALNPALTPAGPMFLAVSYDIMLDLIDVTGLNGPAFWDASMSLGSMIPDASAGGLTMFTDWNMPAGTMLLGSRQGAASYGGPDSSADIRVVDVSLLGIDIGVYFYAALAIEYPEAFAKLSGVTATAASSTSSTAAKK